MKKFFTVVLLFLILFTFFVYFGGGSAVKYVGEKTVKAGEKLENLEIQMKQYIQKKIERIQKIEKSLLSSS